MSRFQVDPQSLREIDEVPGACDFVTYQNERERAISQGSECKTTQEMSPRPASTGTGFYEQGDRATSSLLSGSIELQHATTHPEDLEPLLAGADHIRNEMLTHEDHSARQLSDHPEDDPDFDGRFIPGANSRAEGHFESEHGSSPVSFHPEDATSRSSGELDLDSDTIVNKSNEGTLERNMVKQRRLSVPVQLKPSTDGDRQTVNIDDADGVGPNFDSAIDGYINTFNQMDIDSNGVINYDEFKEICARIGLFTDDECIKEMFYQANLNGDNCLGLDEFVQLQLKYQQHTSVEEVEDALKVFERGKGFFTRAQIRRILTKMGDKMEPGESDEIISYIPFDERNEISFDLLMTLLANSLDFEREQDGDTDSSSPITPSTARPVSAAN